ncbi:MAG: hypothetical protein ACLP6G_19080 [Terriglobales bacterium]
MKATMTPAEYKALQDAIVSDIERIERESEVKRAKRPLGKKRVACGCNEHWVCAKHRGDEDYDN